MMTTQVTAVSRNLPELVSPTAISALDVLICGDTGDVYTSWWRGGQGWAGVWDDIGGVFPPAAPVTAVSRDPNNLDAFICGNDGCVYTSGQTLTSPWSGLGDKWRDIGGVFPPGASVAAVSRNPNQLDLFICGNDGHVYTSWWTAGSDWSGLGDKWRDIGGVFPPGSPVAAVSRNPNQLDLFICGTDGHVYT
jgi:Kazal-type serine protease inhibitor domain